MVGYKDGMEVDWGCWSQGGTGHNDKPGRGGEQMEGDDGKEVRRDLPQ